MLAAAYTWTGALSSTVGFALTTSPANN